MIVSETSIGIAKAQMAAGMNVSGANRVLLAGSQNTLHQAKTYAINHMPVSVFILFHP